MGKRGRPATLIDRKVVIETALRIIDAEGIGAMSMRRLAAELNVTGPSLYYHFDSKEALLDEVGRLVIRGNKVPQVRPADWREAVIQGSLKFYAALRQHPRASPLMIDRRARQFGADWWEYVTSLLHEGGVDDALVMPMLEGLEALTIGEALFENSAAPDAVAFGPDTLAERPNLAKSVESDTFSKDERFEAMVRAFVNGWPIRPR